MQSGLVDGVEQRIPFVAGIDQNGHPRFLVGDEEAVLLERTDDTKRSIFTTCFPTVPWSLR